MRTGPAVLLSLVVGALGGFLVGQRQDRGGKGLPGGGQGLPGGPKPLYAATCEAHVKLFIEYDAQNKPHIVADPPQPVCLARGRSLIWDVAGKGKVTIVFREQEDEHQQKQKGPFHKDPGNTFNTGIGVYERDLDTQGVGPVDSNPAKHIARDRPWKYTVKWKVPGPDQPADNDPAVCVRD